MGRYVITSTRQIKPSVLQDLRGADGLPGRRGEPGPAGPTGPAGATGVMGLAGATGATGPSEALMVTRVENDVTESATGLQQVNAVCPAGYTLTGGGAGIVGNASDVIDSLPLPASPSTTWEVIYDVPTVGDVVTSEAICERLTP